LFVVNGKQQMNLSSKRARQVAIIGFVLSVLFFVAVFVIGGFNGSWAVLALSWQILGGALIWFVLVLQFHQRTLAEQEKLDLDQIAQAKRSETIFQADAERGQLFAVARQRLGVLEKWCVPAFAVLIAAYQIVLGWLLLVGIEKAGERVLSYNYLAAVLMVAVAFASFLLSRYATGMSAQSEWKPLRAGGSYLVSSAVLAFLVAIALTLHHFKLDMMAYVMSWVIPILMTVLGAETALNAVFDIYRPRIAGQYSRSAFDSRLLGMVSEPGGILNTFAGAIDYQFGFKVSQTWFYKLLEEAILPLILFSVATLYLLSTILVVEPGRQALVERFGSFHRLAGPGITLKRPWPFDVARIYDTERIQQVNVGFELEEGKEDSREPLLWGEKHHKEEDRLLVAAQTGDTESKGVPVSLIVAAVPVQYRIKNLKDYAYNHVDARAVLRAICYRELVKYAASAKVETDGDDDERQSILGAGREAAAALLTKRIMQKADEAGLGVEIVYLGLEGVHPPPDEDVAKTYQEVIGAVQKKYAVVMAAEAEQNRILISLTGGDVERAAGLYDLARRYQRAQEELKKAKDADAVRHAEASVETLAGQLNAAIQSSSGDIFQTLREASSDAFEKVVLAEATGKRYESQLLAYRAAKTIFPHELRLAMLEEALAGVRKYVILAEEGDAEVYIIDLQEQQTPDLYNLNMEALEAIRSNR
jgi:modulator of FtsH protease HflK